MRRAWVLLVSVIVAGTAGYFALPSGLPQTLAYDALAITAAVALLGAVVLGVTDARAQWLMIGLGVLAFALGDVVYGESQPVPSVADMFYISSYPLLAVGLAGLGARRRVSHLSSAVAAGLITGMVVFVSWVFLFLPGPNGFGSEMTTRVVALGYPALDLLLLGLLARAIVTERSLPGTYMLFGGGLGLWLVADIAYALDSFGTAYRAGGAVDAAWLLAYAGLGAAALHPSAWGVDADGNTTVVRLVGRGYIQDVRFADIVKWSGRSLLALSVVAVMLGAAWRAIDIVMLAGMYGTTGGVMSLVGASRSGTVVSLPTTRRSLSSAA